jgi:hypothetical protein
MKKHLFLAVALTVLVGGCGTVTRHGDARVIDNQGRFVIGIPKRYWLGLPPVSLAQPATYIFHVTGLPERRFTYYFLLRSPHRKSDASSAPFRDCSVSLQATAPDGSILIEGTYILSTLSWSIERRGLYSLLAGKAEALEQATDYALRITVLTPSQRADILSIHAAAY